MTEARRAGVDSRCQGSKRLRTTLL
jgi:hypothetical protein